MEGRHKGQEMAEEKQRTVDVWLILVIILIVLAIGGGLWATGKGITSRLDALTVRFNSRVGTLETELVSMQKQLVDLTAVARKSSQCAASTRPIPDGAKVK